MKSCKSYYIFPITFDGSYFETDGYVVKAGTLLIASAPNCQSNEIHLIEFRFEFTAKSIAAGNVSETWKLTCEPARVRCLQFLTTPPLLRTVSTSSSEHCGRESCALRTARLHGSLAGFHRSQITGDRSQTRRREVR